jgi:hypothetical protein
MIEMHVQRCLRQIVVVVNGLDQAFGQIPCRMVIDIDNGRDAMLLT